MPNGFRVRPSVPADADACERAAVAALARWRAEVAAGLRAHDALSRAACYALQARDLAREARAVLGQAERATSVCDGVRFAACALTLTRSAAVWNARAAEAAAAYRPPQVPTDRSHRPERAA